LSIFIRSEDIRAQTGKGSEIAPNLASFNPPPFFSWGGQVQKFLNRDYEIEHTFRHAAKFRGGRPTEFRDMVAKK